MTINGLLIIMVLEGLVECDNLCATIMIGWATNDLNENVVTRSNIHPPVAYST